MKLNSIFTKLIPPEVHTDYREQYYWVNTISIILVLALLGLYYFLQFMGRGLYTSAWFTLVLLLLLLSGLPVIKYLKNRKLAGTLMVLALYSEITLLSFIFSNPFHTDIIWYASLPVLGILSGGVKRGVFWGSMCLLTLTVFFMLEQQDVAYGLYPPPANSVPRMKWYQIISVNSLVAMITWASVNAEKSRLSALRHLHTSQQSLQEKVQELKNTHKELQASEEELRQNAEELQAMNDTLSSTQASLQQTLQAERQAAEALRESEYKFRELVETMNEGLVAMDEEGIITFANPSTSRMLGFSVSEVVGQRPERFLDATNLAIFRREYSRPRGSGPVSFELAWKHKNGQAVHTMISPTPVFKGEGQVSGLVVVLTDITPLKQAEREIRTREEKLQAVFSNAAVGIGIIDTEGAIVSVNRAWEEMSGYTAAELTGKLYINLMHPADREDSLKALREISGKSKHSMVERRMVRKNSEVRWVTLSPSPLVGPQGQPEGIISIIVDITGQKEARQALKESEEKYRMITEKANEGIVISVNERIVMHNPKLREMTGYSAEELHLKSLRELVHPEDWHKVAQRMNLAGQPQWPVASEPDFRMVAKDGTERWYGTVSAVVEWEGQQAVQDLLEDITERKKAEDKLKKYELIISTATEFMSLINRDFCYVSVNQAFCQQTGLPYEQVVGKHVQEILGEAYFEKLLPVVSRCFQGETQQYQRWFPAKPGGTDKAVYMDVIYRPVFEEDGSVSGVVVVAKDITSLQKAREALNAKNQQLKQSLNELRHTLNRLKTAQSQLIDAEKMASLGQLTAGIAHEINNPVNFISGNINPLIRDLEELREGYRMFASLYQTEGEQLKQQLLEVKNYLEEIDVAFLFEEIQALTDGIKEGAWRTREIVAGLRNFSRMDQENSMFSDINEGLDSTLLLLRSKMKNRIKVQKDFAVLPKIECFPGRLNQVFMNILNNAEQAIGEHGKIFIKTAEEDGYVQVFIRDTGGGMPEAVRSRIFEPFFTTKEPGKGTGLGLSISYGIIEQHNGSIKVSSQPGKGTEFTITLPKLLKGS